MNQASSILIVDDAPLGRETLGALLMNQGYQLLFAADGAGAIDVASKTYPDLILLDIMMPDMDGYEVCKRIRAAADLAEVPIMLITTLDDRVARLRGIEAGADDFIVKPFDRVELRTRVRTITRLNRYRRINEERLRSQQAEKEIERRNQELALLQKTNELKSELVSNVAHELRNPLTVMTLTIDNLITLYDQISDDQRRKLIQQITKQTAILNYLVENVMSIARLDSERALLELESIDFTALAIDEVERQQPIAFQKKQNLRLEQTKRLCVQGNHGRLQQILCNLISNSLKYTPEGGEIDCAIDMLRAPTTAADWPGCNRLSIGMWAAFRIKDNGVGIKECDIGKIFERFYRVKAQSNVAGSGLGLAIAHELAKSHNGYIGVSSTFGEGSCFALYLPLCNGEIGETGYVEHSHS